MKAVEVIFCVISHCAAVVIELAAKCGKMQTQLPRKVPLSHGG